MDGNRTVHKNVYSGCHQSLHKVLGGDLLPMNQQSYHTIDDSTSKAKLIALNQYAQLLPGCCPKNTHCDGDTFEVEAVPICSIIPGFAGSQNVSKDATASLPSYHSYNHH